jgi:uncharacterized glyoxalase superfamily protein PhnB
MTIAIKKNLEILDVVQVSENRLQTKLNTQEDQTRQGNTIRTDLQIQGSKIFMDAAWKKRKVYCCKKIARQELEYTVNC